MPKTVRKQLAKKPVSKANSTLVQRTTHTRDRIIHSVNTYLDRRPHRSFKLTRRRDYSRSLELPGYVGLNFEVWRILRKHKRLFGGLALIYALIGALFVGLSSQDAYSQLSDLIDQTGSDFFSGGWGSLGQAALLLATGLSGSLSPQLNDVQQVYSVILFLLTLLTAVWLLRAVMMGKNPRLRDGLYNAGSPILATGIVLVIMVVQLIPAALGVVVFNAAVSTGLFASGVMAMLITIAVGLAILLSLYWATSTIIALVVVTLPGMYPWQAIVTAGDLVIGRRSRILKRLLWLSINNVFLWALVILPVIFIDRLIKQAVSVVEWVPFVPIAIAIVTSFIVVWSAMYVYVLYRKVVDDDASPA